jgi:uncharacterized membrane protein
MASGRPSSPWLLILCYAGPLGVLPLLMARTDRSTRWHAKNGLLLFAMLAAIGVAATLVGIAAPSLSCIYGITMLAAGTAYGVVAVLAIVKALGGERLCVAGISRYADRF